MKKSYLYMAASAVLISSSLVACNDLDTKPQGRYVTAQEKAEAMASNPELASAGVVGISASLTPYAAVYDQHFDFGWPGVMLFLDNIGPDLVGKYTGYNWQLVACQYNLGTDNNYVNNMAWYHSYKTIKSANTVLENIDPETTDPELQIYAAQAFANRAASYFALAQLFQKTYKGNESLPCVPLITNLNANTAATDGAPRATVQEVYDQILSDIDQAIKMLTECGLPVSKIASVGTKRFVSLGTAYGIRARVNLVMNNWNEAAADAAKAISESGATPYSIAEASKPAFWNSEDHNFMWAVFVQENDRVVTTGICNWPSMMGSFNSNGYWTVGAFRRINIALYNQINDTDVRKGWWLDGNGVSDNLSAAQQQFVSGYKADPYTQVKFAPYQDKVGTTTNANDIPLMRVEEMYLIQAEATAMGGNATGGKQMLEDFVTKYRDPKYTCSATTSAEVQEAVWTQRRIELWGEGVCYYDLLRLNKGLDRRGGGYESVLVYNVEAPLKPLLIPNGEMNANPAIPTNNDSWNRPTAVDDYE